MKLIISIKPNIIIEGFIEYDCIWLMFKGNTSYRKTAFLKKLLVSIKKIIKNNKQYYNLTDILTYVDIFNIDNNIKNKVVFINEFDNNKNNWKINKIPFMYFDIVWVCV